MPLPLGARSIADDDLDASVTTKHGGEHVGRAILEQMEGRWVSTSRSSAATLEPQPEIIDVAFEGVLPVYLNVTIPANEQNPRRIQMARKKQEQAQAGGICPAQILHQQHDRL